MNKSIILIILFTAFQLKSFAEAERPLTLEEKIGQLFVIPASQLLGSEHVDDLLGLIREGRAGGILLQQGTSEGQRQLIERLQKASSIPLLCLQDGEFGVAMRLFDAAPFPRNLTLGAVQDLSLLYQLGQEIGRQCALVGVHINLAPVADVNSNPLNPIIHMRSFGEDPFQVALRAEMLVRGMQSMGIFACAKHFPGHGDTSVDSHVDLPHLNHDWEEMQKIELFPFYWLIQSGVRVVMSAHLDVASLLKTPSLPATFSEEIITTLLQEIFHFKGLVISDALNMRALAKSYPPGEVALKALRAGHDLLLYGDHIAPNIREILRFHVPEAFAALKRAVENKEISEALIDAHVDKILQAKRELGLFEKIVCGTNGEINSPNAHALKRRLFEEAITVIRNEGALPLVEGKIALIGAEKTPFFTALLAENRTVENISLTDPELFAKVQGCSVIVIALSEKEENLAILARSEIPVIAVLFCTPYNAAHLPLFSSIVIAYENAREAQEAAANVLLGRLPPKGRLPVSVDPFFPVGTGL